MKQHLVILFFLAAVGGAVTAQPQIVIGQGGDTASAKILATYIGKMMKLPPDIVAEPSGGKPAIFVGCHTAAENLALACPDALPEGSYHLHAHDGSVLLAGDTPRAAFALLEWLGCRKWSPRDSLIPRLDTWAVADRNVTESPAFAWRELHYQNAFDEWYAHWHGLTQNSRKRSEWGLFVHTFQVLCPSKLHFEKHPEWFSFNGAQRVPDGQLCLTNDELKKHLTAALRDSMARKPAAKYWSVSQNDNFNYCKCDRCKASDERYGGPSGTMIAFVNDIAAEFPDKVISTLAYQYTRSAPKNIKPLPNVNIMFCSIECNRGLPLTTDPTSKSFTRDFDDWAALTSNFYLWDYVVQFRSYVSPFPNLAVLQPNLQYFRSHRPDMIFEQGSGRDRSEFSDLRAYLIAKWLWNPDLSRDSLLQDFCRGVYAEAAPYIIAYIKALEQHVAEAPGHNVWIYAVPQVEGETFLRPEHLQAYNALFDKAEAAATLNPRALARVREARLPLLFAELELAKIREPSLWVANGSEWSPNPIFRKKLEQFVAGCRAAGIQNLHENKGLLEYYEADMELYLANGRRGHLASGKPVSLETPASATYAKGSTAVLTDGFCGQTDYRFHYLGFEGTDMSATLDLGSKQEVSSLETHFLSDQEAWIFWPRSVTFEASADGKNWKTLHTKTIEIAPLGKKQTTTVSVRLTQPVKCRYIRVQADNLQSCPPWHSCNGQKCWIFCDEVVVK